MKKKMRLSEMTGVLLVFIGIVLATGAENPALSTANLIVQAISGLATLAVGAWLIKKENP